VEVLLLNEQGNPVYSTRTNDAGYFIFSDLGNATYTVYTEIVGIETIPFDVTLNDQNNNPTVNVVKNGQALLGIDDINSAYVKSIDNIYPNPVVANASISISIKESSDITIEIVNQFGQSLYSNKTHFTTGEHKVVLPSALLSQGMYFVKITANDDISSVRKFIKLR